MLQTLKKMIRTHQTHFPAILEAKFATQRLYRRAMRRTHEYDFNALALFPKPINGVFIDVGANRGQSIDSIRILNQTCEIHAVEASPILARKLIKLYANDPLVKIHHLALGSNPGEITLFVPVYRDFVFDGLASSNKASVVSWMANNMLHFDETKLSFIQHVCERQCLDNLHLAPYFIKLDVQGDEFDVLLGAKQTLGCHKPILLVEGGEPEMFAYLSEFGYSGYTFSHGRFVPGVRPGCNAFHLTARHLAELAERAR